MRSLKSVCMLLCMAVASACGGELPEDVNTGEGEATPMTEAVSNDTSAQGLLIPPGCGSFKQRCCADNVCYNGLECDPSSKTCLY
ncbi:hypothetical protein CYFUS_006534 [Cystobacter fuscus]|uniref:Lipoprotein n=1 Tax=Cystobacter fuscus TaxID=43 RepID=A0A250JC68_9BACT|nr:hypothetical protein CYFUS_006534 [Cystobacter fuscus]